MERTDETQDDAYTPRDWAVSFIEHCVPVASGSSQTSDGEYARRHARFATNMRKCAPPPRWVAVMPELMRWPWAKAGAVVGRSGECGSGQDAGSLARGSPRASWPRPSHDRICHRVGDRNPRCLRPIGHCWPRSRTSRWVGCHSRICLSRRSSHHRADGRDRSGMPRACRRLGRFCIGSRGARRSPNPSSSRPCNHRPDLPWRLYVARLRQRHPPEPGSRLRIHVLGAGGDRMRHHLASQPRYASAHVALASPVPRGRSIRRDATCDPCCRGGRGIHAGHDPRRRTLLRSDDLAGRACRRVIPFHDGGHQWPARRHRVLADRDMVTRIGAALGLGSAAPPGDDGGFRRPTGRLRRLVDRGPCGDAAKFAGGTSPAWDHIAADGLVAWAYAAALATGAGWWLLRAADCLLDDADRQLRSLDCRSLRRPLRGRCADQRISSDRGGCVIGRACRSPSRASRVRQHLVAARDRAIPIARSGVPAETPGALVHCGGDRCHCRWRHPPPPHAAQSRGKLPDCRRRVDVASRVRCIPEGVSPTRSTHRCAVPGDFRRGDHRDGLRPRRPMVDGPAEDRRVRAPIVILVVSALVAHGSTVLPTAPLRILLALVLVFPVLYELAFDAETVNATDPGARVGCFPSSVFVSS